MAIPHLFFSAGEASGDLHAARVAALLPGLLPDIRQSGIAGDRMIASGVTPLFHIRDTAVMGFTEVLRNYSRIRRIFTGAVDYLRSERPDLLVCVDYPGFNLRLAAEARRIGIPVLYYIAPKTWAHGAGRLKAMARDITRLAVIFPFEEAHFARAGINATYVGNPVAESIDPPLPPEEWSRRYNLPVTARVLGLLPGSRRQEVDRHLPAMAGGARRLLDLKRFELVLVSRMAGLESPAFRALEGDSRFILCPESSAAIIERSEFLFVKSGTATLETALGLKPFVTGYRLSPLSCFLVRRFVRLKDYSMINICLGRSAVPELIQEALTPDRLARETTAILDSTDRRTAMIASFRGLKEDLSAPSASHTVAHLIREMIHG